MLNNKRVARKRIVINVVRKAHIKGVERIIYKGRAYDARNRGAVMPLARLIRITIHRARGSDTWMFILTDFRVSFSVGAVSCA